MKDNASATPFVRRSCYINYAEHLLNAYNPNMAYPDLPYRWSDQDWARFIDMIASFGFNIFEFWLTPRLFSRAGLREPFGLDYARQIRTIIEHGARRGVRIKLLAALTTVGDDWHTHCPNDKAEWRECVELWDAWTKRLPGLGMVGIFPGDPGGCSRNGCTPRTYIDKSLEIAGIVHRNLPEAEIELGTWGPPFFAWGNIQGPPGWNGDFIPSYQGTAWTFDKARADDSMNHLLKRLPSFPERTVVAINLGFNSDGNPETDGGAQDARLWAREIAKIRPISTWDFSLTEGENAIVPHYRFDRLFAQRRKELAAAPYSGGICFTMTPRLNQLSLFQSAQSFLNPQADHHALTREFYTRLFGKEAQPLADLLPLLEIIPDWGNYAKIEFSRDTYHRRMTEGVDLLTGLAGKANTAVPFLPDVEQYRQELLFYFTLFAELTGKVPDFDTCHKRYWNRVYAIYDQLPTHVDPRPRFATERLIRFFDPASDRSKYGALPDAWWQS